MVSELHGYNGSIIAVQELKSSRLEEQVKLRKQSMEKNYGDVTVFGAETQVEGRTNKEDHVICKIVRSRKMSYAYGGNKTRQEKIHRYDNGYHDAARREAKNRSG